MNRHRYANIKRLTWGRSFSDKKKTLFKSVSYVSEENMLEYFFMMFYADEMYECASRTGFETQSKKESLCLADCLPNLNLIFFKWNKNYIKQVQNVGLLKKIKHSLRAAIIKGSINYIAEKKEKICFVYLKCFAIIKKTIDTDTDTEKSRLVESNVINDYLKLLVFLDHKSRQCFYSLHSFLLPEMTLLRSGLSRTIKNLTGFRKTGKGVIWGMMVAAVLLLAPGVFAENVKYASALVWNTDGKGDYNLPIIAANSHYVSLPVVVSKSVISSLTVTWICDGEVTMEVSADGGAHYTPAVNGVPLTKNFTQGTSIRWQACVGVESVLKEVRVSYTDAAGLSGSFGAPELSGFKYRKNLFVKGVEKKTLFNYQVNLKVGESEVAKDAELDCNSHVLADFNDVRFTLADGETIIPHYLEKVSGASGKRIADFIIKIPQIPPTGTPLYIYYGNPQAQSLSDGKKVFDFYDDFKAHGLDKDVWNEVVSTGVSVTEDGLVLDAAAILSKEFQFKGGIIEVSAGARTGQEIRLIIRQGNGQPGMDKSQVAYSSTYSGAEHCIAVGDIVKANESNAMTRGERYDYRVKVLGDEITFERYAPDFGGKPTAVTYIDTGGLKTGVLGLKTSGTARGGNAAVFHWIRVRKHVEPGPVVDKGQTGGEQEVNAPYFEGVVLSPKGNLIVKEGYKEGAYITPVTYAAFDIRILSPSWEGEGARMDITADGGKSAYVNCDKFNYYYVSREDFNKGRELKTKVVLKDKDAFLKELNVLYALGSVNVLSPNGGEIWNIGAEFEIVWTAADYDKSYLMKIEYSLDGGRNFTLLAPSVENSGTYNWRILSGEDLVTEKARIRISDSYDPSIEDVSDGNFWIVPASLQYGLSGKAAGAVGNSKRVERERLRADLQRKELLAAAGGVDLGSLMSKGKRPGAKLYDVMIKLGNNTLPNNPEEDARACFKDGDIVMVVPHGHNWSDTERNSSLIVQMHLTPEEAADLTQPKEIETGEKDKSGAEVKKITRVRKHRFDFNKLGFDKKRRKPKDLDTLRKIIEGKEAANN